MCQNCVLSLQSPLFPTVIHTLNDLVNAFHVLVALHHVDHDCSKVVMRNLMFILWDALFSGVYDWLHDYMQLDYILVC